MKRVSGNRLRQEAQKYQQLQNHINQLEASEYIPKIFDLIFDIKLQSKLEKDQQRRDDFKMKNSDETHSKNQMAFQREDVQNSENDTALKENLKLILGMMVDDVWTNFDNYYLQKKVMEQSQNMQRQSSNMTSLSKIKSDTGALNRDFLEPGTGAVQQEFNQNNDHGEYIIDDTSNSDLSKSQISNGMFFTSDYENKENEQRESNFDNKKNDYKTVFDYYTQAEPSQQAKPQLDTVRKVSEKIVSHNKNLKEQSQYQTPQYKHSEIGNPICSPNTEERNSLMSLQNRDNVKQNLMKLNLLSQENSAQEDNEEKKKSQQRIGTDQKDNYQPLKLDQNFSGKLNEVKTPEHLQFNNFTIHTMDKAKEEIMLKNIIEFESNPLFSSGGSMQVPHTSEKKQGGIPISTLEETKTQLHLLKEQFKESQHVEQEKSKRYLAQEEDATDSMGYLDDEDCSIDQEYKDRLLKESPDAYQNRAYSLYKGEICSESKVPMTLQEGKASTITYKTSEGISKKMSKLNLNQATQKVVGQEETKEVEDNDNINDTHLLTMDQEYFKAIPKTGRDQKGQSNHPPLHPQKKHLVTSQDSNSLILSSDHQTKISAEDIMKNYTNANFIPQKTAQDRLHILSQSKELSPLIGLAMENQQLQELEQSEKHSSYHLNQLVQRVEQQIQQEIQNPKSTQQLQLEKQIQQSFQPNYECMTERVKQLNQNRAKTPLINRPISQTGSNSQRGPRNICLTQMASRVEDSQVSKNQNSNDEIRLKTSNAQSEGKYIVNKLAKVIKSKGSSVKSRNSGSKKNSNKGSNVNSFNQNFSNQMITHSEMSQTYNYNGLLKNQISLKDNLEYQIQGQINNQTTTNSNASKNIGFSAYTTHKSKPKTGNSSSRNQQSARNDPVSQYSVRSSASQKANKFQQRRLTQDGNEESIRSNKPLIQAPMNTLGGLQMGNSGSHKNLNGANPLPPHQKSMVHLHNPGQGITVSPSQVMKKMKSGIRETSNSGGSSKGNTSARTLQSAGSHKTLIQSSSAAQAIIYGKLSKNQRN